MLKIIKIVLFFSMLFVFASFVSAVNCWDYAGNQAGCESSSDSLDCQWYDAGQNWCPSDSTGCCEQLECWAYDGNQSACASAPSSMGCTWDDNQYNQEPWCPTSPSNPYTPDGVLVSGADIGCCSMPGCWDADGTNESYCNGTQNSFMDSICVWKTQAEDPYCPDSTGCCMMPLCNDVSTESECDALIQKGAPCSWDGSSCNDPGFEGFDGADSCVANGGFWNGTDCEMPTFDQEVRCWFADFKQDICLNITGCVYCNSTNTQDSNSACYNNQIGWCQGHETLPGATDINQSSMRCSDIKLNGICDCGPLPGCHWTNSSAITGNYCSAGVPQCNLNFEDLTYDKCEDAPNQSECNILASTYFMPCIFNLSGTDECEFDWQSGGGFGDDKGSSDFEFEDIMDEETCQFAGGIWKTVEIDSYGNTEAWCEFGFGQNVENCDSSCWACEYQDDGSPWANVTAAQAACENSAAAGGDCQFSAFGSQASDGRYGWCDFPMEMDFFGGGNCEDSCFDCFNQEMCTNSEANCTWVNDPMGFGPGWCDPAAVAAFMNCTTNALACMGQAQCENEGHNWTNEYVNDPFNNNMPMWVCIENGTTPEVCFIPGDEDGDGDANCADSDCSFDPMCGFGMSDMGPGGPGQEMGGMMLPPEMEELVCYEFDDTSQAMCEAAIVINGSDFFNGTHRGNASYISLPEHMNNTQLCYYHEANPMEPEDFLCDPIYEQQMMGGMEMDKPPTPIGDDDTGDADSLDYLDIVHVGIMDESQTMDIGIPMLNMTSFAVCNDKLGGTSNGTVYRYIDSDANTSTGCTATNGTYDGFDYKLVVQSTYNGSDVSTITAAYRCIDSDNNIWVTMSATLTVIDDACFASTPPITPPGMEEFNGVNVLMFTKSDFGVATDDLKILVATAGPGYNETNVTDQAGPFYYTPGAIDFMMEDCFGFVDMDGDGLTPDQDPDCKFVKQLGFIPFEDCGNNFDDNGDGLTDCSDPMCSFTPMCNGAFNFAASADDTTAPNVLFHTTETFYDGAFIKFDTNEPANGTVFFYYNDSSCFTVNKTINDLGDPGWAFDDYKPFHDVPIDNFAGNPDKLGYDLVNGSIYYYKYKVCDPSGNCAQSACSNFTTETSISNFYFGANVPSGFEVPNPWGDGDLGYAKQINSSAGKNQNLTINCPTAGYSLTLVGVDVKTAKEIDLQGIVCDPNNDVIGMDSDTWDQLLFDLSVDSVIITWNTGGTGATIQHCGDANGTTDCQDVTDYLDCTVTSTTVSCKIPTTLGFSSYKVVIDNNNPPPSGGGGGGSSTKPQCSDLKDNDGDGLIDYPNDPGCTSIEDADETDEVCTEDWSCTEWKPLECPPEGKQARQCGDWNSCGTENYKPATERECEYIEKTVVRETPQPIKPVEQQITGTAVVEPETTQISVDPIFIIGLIGLIAVLATLVIVIKHHLK